MAQEFKIPTISGKIRKSSTSHNGKYDSYSITIPRGLIKYGIINIDEEYDVILRKKDKKRAYADSHMLYVTERSNLMKFACQELIFGFT